MKRIIGYDSTNERMLLEGTDGKVYYSVDGRRAALVTPETTTPTDNTAAEAVPGATSAGVGSKKWPGTTYEGITSIHLCTT